jgi:hypothetical protein
VFHTTLIVKQKKTDQVEIFEQTFPTLIEYVCRYATEIDFYSFPSIHLFFFFYFIEITITRISLLYYQNKVLWKITLLETDCMESEIQNKNLFFCKTMINHESTSMSPHYMMYVQSICSRRFSSLFSSFSKSSGK